MTPGRHRAPITVGIDIGTTSVKALAVSEDGEVLARARVPHRIIHTSAEHMEHSAQAAWRRGPIRALSLVRDALAASQAAASGSTDPAYIAGICVAGMVPSLTGVDRGGIPRTPGLLYGDARGRPPGDTPASSDGHAGPMPDAEGFLRWTAAADAGGLRLLAGPGGGQPRPHRPGQHRHRRGLDPGRAPPRGPVERRALGLPRRASGPDAPGGVDRPAGRNPAAPGDRRGLHREGPTIPRPWWPVAPSTRSAIRSWPERTRWATSSSCSGRPWWCGWSPMPGWKSPACGRCPTPCQSGCWWEAPATPAPSSSIGPAHCCAALPARARLTTVGSGDPRRVPVWLPYVRGERVPFHDTTLRAGSSISTSPMDPQTWPGLPSRPVAS